MSIASHYEFETHWSFPAPQERVWAELVTPEDWPVWWRGAERVELLQAGHDVLGTGAIRRYCWRGRLPYQLRFDMRTVIVRPTSLIEGHATGELEGQGVWRLSHENGITHVRYDWRVEANKWWMRRLSWIARPLFRWNHDVVMRWGRQGLIRRLGISE